MPADKLLAVLIFVAGCSLLEYRFFSCMSLAFEALVPLLYSFWGSRRNEKTLAGTENASNILDAV